MTQFKGTKGEWELESGINNGVITISSKTSYVCDVDADFEEGEYNALLISKAPEMLDMLEKIASMEGMFPNVVRNVSKLIKEATEL